MLPRIQAQLRRQFAIKSEPNTDLLQWSKGSKYFIGNVEGLLRLLDQGSSLEVRVRGPANHEKECFFFLEEILGVIDQVNIYLKNLNVKINAYFDGFLKLIHLLVFGQTFGFLNFCLTSSVVLIK